MDVRLPVFDNPVSGKFLKYLTTASKIFKNSPIPDETVELVSLRVSQINGCAFCVDMHTKELAHMEDPVLRSNMTAAWREANCFTEAERAALELAEEGTRLADAATGVPQDVWDRAAKHYDEDGLATLVSLIAFMNAVNRINVITQQPAGDYVVGQFG